MRPLLLVSLALFCVVGLAANVASAADFYVDPDAGSMQNDGSAQHPWSTLREVMEADLVETQTWDSLPHEPDSTLVPKNPGAPVKAGDTIWLRSGYHGDVVIRQAYNTGVITIAAETGHVPRLRTLTVEAASHWVIRNLAISLQHAPTYEAATLVSLSSSDYQGPTHDVVVEGCDIFSVDDVAGWTKEDWNELPGNAVSVKGSDCTVRGNRIRNVNFGISVTGDHVLVEHNTIDSFAGDGLRGLGDYGVFQYNVVKNCYDVNDNHDDGFQSWSVGEDGKPGTGEVIGVTLRGNTIINYEDPDQPFRGTLQGIGCFDGMFVDWVVENNVIITDHWHGITLMGARNSRIVNNTVLDLNDTEPGPPWIRISAHKNGTQSEGCVVRNNLTTKINIEDGQDVEEDNNIIINDPAEHFVDPGNHDLRLLETSPAVDTGSDELAPNLDRDEIPRPQGNGIDVGAYEYYEGDPVVPDAGAGGSSGSGGGDGGSGGSNSGGTSGAGASAGAKNDEGPSMNAGEDDGGCGCSTVGRAAGSTPAWLCLMVGGLLFAARRRFA